MDPAAENANARASTSNESAHSGRELIHSKGDQGRSNISDSPNAKEVDYDFSIARFVLNYNVFAILFVVLLFCMGINYAPYNNQYPANFNLTILFGFWYTGFEFILSYFVIFSHSMGTNSHILRLLCVITATVCILEGIIASIWIESVFCTLFSLQFIAVDFVSIYTTTYLLIVHKMRRHIAWILLVHIIHFSFKVYSLGLSLVYVHNDILRPRAVGWDWLLLFSVTKLILATEVVSDKMRYVSEAIFHQKSIQNAVDVKKLKVNQMVFAVLSVTVFLVCIIIYSAAGHWSSDENETNGYYPMGLYLEFVLYLNWPLAFFGIFWVCCTRIYVKEKQLRVWSL